MENTREQKRGQNGVKYGKEHLESEIKVLEIGILEIYLKKNGHDQIKWICSLYEEVVIISESKTD